MRTSIMRREWLTFIVFILSFAGASFSQGVGISKVGGSPDNSSGLDIDFSNKGLLIPRMTTTERDAISSPALSLLIFNTTDNCLQMHVEGVWYSVGCANCGDAASISAQPANESINDGDNASFSVTASGTGTLTYQWQESTDAGSTWNNISNGGTNPAYSNATTATLSLTNVPVGHNNYLYRCIVTGTCPPAVTSDNATLTVVNFDKTCGKAYYKFNEASGNLINHATVANGWANGLGSAADGTANGDPTYSQTGKIGNTISLDGAGDFFQLGTSLSQFKFLHDGSDFTIAFWLKMNATDPNEQQGIFGTGEGGSDVGIVITLDDRGGISRDHKLKGRQEDGGPASQILSSDSYIPKNTSTWYHYIITFDGSSDTWNVYRDNANNESATQALAQNTGNHDYAAEIGHSQGFSNQFEELNGQLDEMVIFCRIITAAERATLYNGGAGTEL